MRSFLPAPLVALVLCCICGGEARAARRVFSNTSHVEDMIVTHDAIWAATRGGLERYALDTLERDRLFTTEDGLADNHVLQVEERDGAVHAITAAATCRLQAARLVCESSGAKAVTLPAGVPVLYQGARETRRLPFAGGSLIATAGQGLWWQSTIAPERTRRLTPPEQICGNHVVAVTGWNDRVWFGSFAGGLCSAPAASLDVAAAVRFAPAPLSARFINDLLATPHGLYVATSEGLFVSKDGVAFTRVAVVTQDGANDLALDPVRHAIYVTTPAALWRLPLPQARGLYAKPKGWWQPGGSRSLQAVDVGEGGNVWLASEDRGVLRMRKDGFEVFDRLAGLPTSWALDVAVDGQGGVVIASLRDGALRVRPRGRSVEVSVLEKVSEPWLLHVSRGARGTLFVGSQNGVFVGRAGHFTTIADPPHPCIHAVAESASGTFVASEGGVLFVARDQKK